MKNQNNNGCGCHNHPAPAPSQQADINMTVCDRNANVLPMLQTYTTKVLKPNICCKKNILTQQMMSCEGYKYVIKWDFDLNGQTITVPRNCILEFDGGSLKNGTIIGQDTLFINVGDTEIWGENLTREGTWREKQAGGITDKEYDPEHHSGMGRKTLKLNGDSNILTQNDFDQENTIYVIAYDFDLNGGTIEIPEGCILDFEGGSITSSEEGGKLIGNNTVIEAPITRIFGADIDFDGRWAVDFVYTEWFGAVTDNENIDSTPAIQAAIGFAGNSYGKVVKFLQGYYYFSTITPKHKVSLVGSGIGCTMLKQMTGETGHGIVIDTYYSCMKLEDFTIIGTRAETGNGIHIPDPGVDHTSSRNHPIMEIKGEEHDGARYKYAYINNIAVFKFGTGVYTAPNVYCVFITNCYFTDNLNDGAEIHMTDSTIDNCYLENNGNAGINLFGGNNKVSRLKSIWNGKNAPNNHAGIGVHAARNTITDCETQDNYCRGYYISGPDCLIANCLSNTDGYGDSVANGQTDYMYKGGGCAIGFNIGSNIVGTVFKNCKVSSYRTGGFPATCSYPFTLPSRRIPDSEITPTQYIPDLPNLENIYDEIKVNTMGGFSMFREVPFTSDDSIPTHNIMGEYNHTLISGYRYIEPTNFAHIDVADKSIVFKNGTTIFVSFRIKDVTDVASQYKTFFTIGTKNTSLALQAEVSADKHRLFFIDHSAQRSNHFVEIPNSFHPQDDMSGFITLAITYRDNHVYTRGYFYRIEDALTDKQRESADNCKQEIVFIESGTALVSTDEPFLYKSFGNDMLLDKFFITNDYIPDNYLIPGAPTAKYRNGSLVYIASNNLQTVLKKCGTTEERPELGAANNGFQYYDTTLRKLIVYYSNDWYNVDGTPLA